MRSNSPMLNPDSHALWAFSVSLARIETASSVHPNCPYFARQWALGTVQATRPQESLFWSQRPRRQPSYPATSPGTMICLLSCFSPSPACQQQTCNIPDRHLGRLPRCSRSHRYGHIGITWLGLLVFFFGLFLANQSTASPRSLQGFRPPTAPFPESHPPSYALRRLPNSFLDRCAPASNDIVSNPSARPRRIH